MVVVPTAAVADPGARVPVPLLVRLNGHDAVPNVPTLNRPPVQLKLAVPPPLAMALADSCPPPKFSVPVTGLLPAANVIELATTRLSGRVLIVSVPTLVPLLLDFWPIATTSR